MQQRANHSLLVDAVVQSCSQQKQLEGFRGRYMPIFMPGHEACAFSHADGSGRLIGTILGEQSSHQHTEAVEAYVLST